MLFLTRGRMRTAVSGIAAGALAATALAFAGAPAQAAESSPTVTATVSFGDEIVVAVNGKNFDPQSRPGAMGVYVGIAEKQDIFNIPGDPSEAFFSQAWVTAGEIKNGAFAKTVEVDPAAVTPDGDYAVYTWTAHGNPVEGDSQYTETAVSFAPKPTVTVSAKTSGNKVTTTVEGKNFDPAWRPGAKGVYAGLSHKRNIFKVKSDGQLSGMSAFVASDWVMPNQFTEGAWSKTLKVNKKHLVKGVDYMIYTWTAHGNPVKGDSQYTATPVKIKGIGKAPTKINTKWKKKPTSKKKSALVVAVKSNKQVNKARAANGKVVVKLKKGKQSKKVKAKLNKKGKVNIKLPKLAKGKWQAAVKYGGSNAFKKANKKFNFKVKK